MNKKNTQKIRSIWRVSVILGMALLPVVALASTVPMSSAAPESKCITKATTALRANTLALFAKDTAPYKENADAEAAISEYQHKIDIAWSALQQPYCGFGQKNLNSVKKSYNKTVVRARDAFMTAVKSLGKAKVTTPVPAPKVPAAPKPSSLGRVPSGLQQGMRGKGVEAMQRRLAKHYGLDESSLATGYFGPQTRQMVIKFQLEKGLIDSETDEVAGLVGPRTAKALNRL